MFVRVCNLLHGVSYTLIRHCVFSWIHWSSSPNCLLLLHAYSLCVLEDSACQEVPVRPFHVKVWVTLLHEKVLSWPWGRQEQHVVPAAAVRINLRLGEADQEITPTYIFSMLFHSVFLCRMTPKLILNTVRSKVLIYVLPVSPSPKCGSTTFSSYRPFCPPNVAKMAFTTTSDWKED